MGDSYLITATGKKVRVTPHNTAKKDGLVYIIIITSVTSKHFLEKNAHGLRKDNTLLCAHR